MASDRKPKESVHMKRVLGLVLVGVAAAAAAACSAEASINENAEDWSTSGGDPERVAAAEVALGEASDPEEGWRTGVVLAESGQDDDVLWQVLAQDGTVLALGPSLSAHCSFDESRNLWVTVDPGDLITWSTEGDDLVVCSDEIEVLRKAVIEGGET